MTYCSKCGEKLPEGAQVCPRCNTPVPGASKKEGKDHSGIGSALTLIGGILAIVLNIIPLISMLFLRGTIEDLLTRSAIWSRWGIEVWRMHITRMLQFMSIGAAVTIVLGIIAIYAYTKVNSGKVRNGGTIAIVVAVIMLVVLQWIPGIITLVGGILCYTSKRPDTR